MRATSRLLSTSRIMASKPSVLIVGATRGLGASLAKQYLETSSVYATSRSKPKDIIDQKINWISDVDVGDPNAGKTILKGLDGAKLNLLVLTAGYMAKESFDEPDFDQEMMMYKICSVGPVFVVHHLVNGGALPENSKVIMVTSEGGCITLRHESEGGGMFGHHGSKAAQNMVGKLLSLDLKEKKIPVGMVHPGFMKTEMTKSVGFDKFYEDGGAVSPDEAAAILIKFISNFDMSKTGELWAPRGPIDIGTIEQTVGKKKDLSTPLKLPW